MIWFEAIQVFDFVVWILINFALSSTYKYWVEKENTFSDWYLAGKEFKILGVVFYKLLSSLELLRSYGFGFIVQLNVW